MLTVLILIWRFDEVYVRFFADGPDIPDELLWAQDEGRVVFFCGAGVSMARANLPDFRTLTEKVLCHLNAQPESDARRLFDLDAKVHEGHGIPGVVTSDRVFGLLERDFNAQQVHAAVAECLRTPNDVDLSAHKTLIKLGTLQSGETRLITTNFDRLFERAKRGAKTETRSTLPHIAYNEFDWGIVHLHGVVDDSYSGATKDGFVLSSASFGEAYLAGGWAREFVKSVLERHIAVFIGYQADDPPVRYLLEGLQNSGSTRNPAFAFQSSGDLNAIASWDEKGVQAMEYNISEGCRHYRLWESLDAWANRSKKPLAWRERTLKRAKKGPAKLEPFERGQVAHIVKSISGAQAFQKFDPLLPSDWLCTFDSAIRYGEAGNVDGPFTNSPVVEPFLMYGLDSDPPPNAKTEDQRVGRMPQDVWDAFWPTDADLRDVQANQVSHLRGRGASAQPYLPRRIDALASWIVRTALEPACAWWAGQQGALHSIILNRIRLPHEVQTTKKQREIVGAWRALLEVQSLKNDHDRAYTLSLKAKPDNWAEAEARDFARCFNPSLKLTNWRRRPIPPKSGYQLRQSDMVRVEVEYGEGIRSVEVPDHMLASIVPKLRNALMLAQDLENRYGALTDICSIEQDEKHPDEGDDDFHRQYKLSGHVIRFAELFRQLADRAPEIALHELRSWPHEGRIFERLRIWAYGLLDIAPASEFARILLSLNDDAFWPFKGARDFLLGLSRRWEEIPEDLRKKMEKRILRGPKNKVWRSTEENIRIKASSSLTRLLWLREKGCVFTFDLDEKVKKLRERAPDWKEEFIAHAARAHDGGGGAVRVEQDYSVLDEAPDEDIITRIESMETRPIHLLVEYDPFLGLSTKDPQRALNALRIRNSKGHFDEEYWQRFLRSDIRKDDPDELTVDIANALLGVSDEHIAQIKHHLSQWFEKAGPKLAQLIPEVFEQLWRSILEIVTTDSESRNQDNSVGSTRRDLASAAINAPAGYLTQMLIAMLDSDDLKAQGGLSDWWKSKAEQLIGLQKDDGLFALLIFSHQTNFLFHWDEAWSRTNILSVFDNQDADRKSAFWAGFLWAARTPNLKLYRILKPHLIQQIAAPTAESGRYMEVLSGIIFSGWLAKPEPEATRLIGNNELTELILRASANFQRNVLWTAQRWTEDDDERWARDIVEFLKQVWPKQLSLRTTKTSEQLVELSLRQKINYPEVVEAVLPLLTRVGPHQVFIPTLRKTDETVAGEHPEATLALLHAILPDERSHWPYGAEDALRVIVERAPELASDSRYIELVQRI